MAQPMAHSMAQTMVQETAKPQQTKTRWLIKITFFTDIQFSGIHKEINHVYVPSTFLVQYL